MACSRFLPVQGNHCCLLNVRRDPFLPLLWTPLLLTYHIRKCWFRWSFIPTHPPRKPDPTTTQIHLTSWYPPPSLPRKPWCHKQGGKKCYGILARLNHRTSVWSRSGYSTEHSLLLGLWMVGDVNGCYNATEPHVFVIWIEWKFGLVYYIDIDVKLIEWWVTERGRATRRSHLVCAHRWPTGPTHHSCFAIRALAEPGAKSSVWRAVQTQSHIGLT